MAPSRITRLENANHLSVLHNFRIPDTVMRIVVEALVYRKPNIYQFAFDSFALPFTGALVVCHIRTAKTQYSRT
jgi:hypothetical protein